MIKAFPAVIGSDIAGEVVEVGANVTKFRKGNRAVGHAWSLLTGKPEDGAFSLFSRVPAKNAAAVPAQIKFWEAAVLPMAIDTAVAGLFQGDPTLGLPLPTVEPTKTGEVVVVYGASGSVGSMAVQLATAAGAHVIAIASMRNFDMVRSCGAQHVFDYKSDTVIEDVVKAVGNDKFVGIFDSISSESTFAIDVAIFEKLGGGRLATTHDLPTNLPSNVRGKYVFGIGEYSFPVWEKYVSAGLESGELKCLPQPQVVGNGLESLQLALEKAEAGVSAAKIVVEV